MTILTMAACGDASAPRSGGPSPVGPTVSIVPLVDSVFEGDVVRLTAKVFDDGGVERPASSVTWTVSDTNLAKVASDGSFTLVQPGTVRIMARSDTATATYDLVIGRLVVKRVELTPGALSMGRGDRVPVAAGIFGQGDRTITRRTVTFTSGDSLVAIVPGLVSTGAINTGLLLAVGPGSATIRASVDGVTGSAHVGVVVADTLFVLTHFNGTPLPALVASDSITVNGVKELDEVYADTGTLVVSGLLQARYRLNVQFSQYHVIRTGDTVRRELRVQAPAEFDKGIITVGASGSLTMLSEFIGPHLEHSAVIQPDGYLVHFHIPGEDLFSDLKYRRVVR